MRFTNLHSSATSLTVIARPLFLPQSLPLRAIHVSEAVVAVVVDVKKSVSLFTLAAVFRTALLTSCISTAVGIAQSVQCLGYGLDGPRFKSRQQK